MPVLLCQNVDRVTRNFRDAVDLDDMRINNGLEIHFVQDGFILSSKAGGGEMFMWEAKVFLAKQYINRLTDDAVRSTNHKIEHEEWVSKAPLRPTAARLLSIRNAHFLLKGCFRNTQPEHAPSPNYSVNRKIRDYGH